MKYDKISKNQYNRNMFELYVISTIFSGIGFIAWKWGRKNDSPPHMTIGAALMFYSWVIDEPWTSFGIGLLLTIWLFKKD